MRWAGSLHWLAASSISDRLAVFGRQLLAGEGGGYCRACFRSTLQAAMKVPVMGWVSQREWLSFFRFGHATARFVGTLSATPRVRALFYFFFRAHVADQCVLGVNTSFYNKVGA